MWSNPNNKDIEDIVFSYTIDMIYKEVTGVFIKYQNGEINPDFLDETLKKIYEKGGNNKLKDIITTISKLQFEIRNYILSKNLLIDGKAGTGKSNIILHRLSYLNYNNKIKPLVITPSINLKEYYINSLSDDEFHINKDMFLSITDYYLMYLNNGNIIKDIEILSEDKINKETLVKIYNEKIIKDLLKNYCLDFNSFLNHTKAKIDLIKDDLNNKINLSKEEFNKEKKKYINSIMFYKDLGTLFKHNTHYLDETKLETTSALIKKEYKEIEETLNEDTLVLYYAFNKQKEDKEKNKHFLARFIDYEQERYQELLEYSKNQYNKKIDEYNKKINSLDTFNENLYVSSFNPNISNKLNHLINFSNKVILENKDYFLDDSINTKFLPLKEMNIDKINKFIIDNVYLYILDKIDINKEIERNKYYKCSLFLKSYLKNELIDDEYNENKYDFIMFDEYQDYALSEYNLIYNLNIKNTKPPIFNLFGDINQTIYEYAINNIDDLKNRFNLAIKELDTNYRNKKEILNFINLELNTNFIGKGLNGGSIKFYKDLNEVTFKKDSILIVKNEKIKEQVKPLIKDNINILTIKEVKGLEFDKVYLLKEDLNKEDLIDKNMLYIAYSRAITTLNIIESI